MIINFNNINLNHLTQNCINVSKCYSFSLSLCVEARVLTYIRGLIKHNIRNQIYILIKRRLRNL